MMRTNTYKLALFCLQALVWCGAARTNATTNDSGALSVEDTLRVREFGQLTPISLSPDGDWVAYTVRDNQRARTLTDESVELTGIRSAFTGTDIWICNLGLGKETNLTAGEGDNWMPVWSPDGHYLAFLSDRDGSGQARLWVWDKTKNHLREVAATDVRSQEIQWTPDSRKIVVTARPMSSTVEHEGPSSGTKGQGASLSKTPGPTVVFYQSNEIPGSDPWSLNVYLRDLAIIDLATGETTTIVDGRRVASYLLSPDGSRIAYTNPKAFEKAGSQQILFDLVEVTISTKDERVIASTVRLDYDGASFSWSPDSTKLSYRTGGVDERTYDCYVVELEKGEFRNVTSFSEVSEQFRYKSDAPLWDAKGERIFFIRNGGLWQSAVSADKPAEVIAIPDHRIRLIVPQFDNMLCSVDQGRSTIVLTYDEVGKEDGFYRVDLIKKVSSKLLETGQCYSCANVDHPIRVATDGRHIAYFAEDAMHDQDLWASDPNFKNPHRVTHLNPQFDSYKMGAARLISWLGDDGGQLQGALLLPVDYKEGKRYPLIVYVYGGDSLSNRFDHFGLAGSGPFNMQLLATRGYAVLFPDAPQHLDTPMLDLAKTVLPGVNRVIDIGIADPNCIGIMGHSYGGYSALALIVQSTRFMAAIDLDGYADLIGFYGQMSRSGTTYGTAILENGQGLMGGTPWQVRERYIENSPIFHLDRIKTPLLIIHASADTAVAPFLGDEVFVALRRLGKEVGYAKYEGESHSPIYWSYPNQVDFCNRMIAWFDLHLSRH